MSGFPFVPVREWNAGGAMEARYSSSLGKDRGAALREKMVVAGIGSCVAGGILAGGVALVSRVRGEGIELLLPGINRFISMASSKSVNRDLLLSGYDRACRLVVNS